MIRPAWSTYFGLLAETVSLRADCSRRQVGAVLVDPEDHSVIAVGYNGSYRGGPSCLAGQCPRAQSNVEPGSSYDTGAGACIALHAEQNVIIEAGRKACVGKHLYITHEPCDGCVKMIRAAGISKVHWSDNRGVWTMEY